jgi:hypothetical protein
MREGTGRRPCGAESTGASRQGRARARKASELGAAHARASVAPWPGGPGRERVGEGVNGTAGRVNPLSLTPPSRHLSDQRNKHPEHVLR